ncbi:MAG TPA: ArdC family protein [Solirubrobacteraceae bacterium]|jgi:hypothetical protein|nr:ArdC family protein [Solirubrobacteraceae bacterium]
MATTKRHMSEARRAERRAQDRERVEIATRALLSSDGWRRWVRARAVFHNYSACNCMLLALQCHQRGIEPRRVAGFRAWQKLGRQVTKGQYALWVMAPMAVVERDASGEETGEKRLFFRSVPVYESSQTHALPGVAPAPLEPPREPLTGDSHAHLLAPLRSFAESLGYSVSFENIPGSAGGWCDANHKQIVVDAAVPANAQLRTLIHEVTHALGVTYDQYSRPQAEVIVDTVTHITAAAVGLAVDGETIPYIAGWCEDGALDAVTEFAGTIDELAGRIESALGIDVNVGTAIAQLG